jgi:hypothetical protein
MAKTIALADLDHDMGHDGNMPGIEPQLIYGYHEDVSVWPTEPAPAGDVPLTMDAAGKLVGDVVMKPGTRAYTLDFTEDTGLFKINTVGQQDGESFEYDLTLIKAKIQARILGFINAAHGRKMFFIVTDENGVNYLMGSKKRSPKLQSGGDGITTGTTSGDRNQVSLNFKFSTAKALAYVGDVEDVLIASPAS